MCASLTHVPIQSSHYAGKACRSNTTFVEISVRDRRRATAAAVRVLQTRCISPRVVVRHQDSIMPSAMATSDDSECSSPITDALVVLAMRVRWKIATESFVASSYVFDGRKRENELGPVLIECSFLWFRWATAAMQDRVENQWYLRVNKYRLSIIMLSSRNLGNVFMRVIILRFPL